MAGGIFQHADILATHLEGVADFSDFDVVVMRTKDMEQEVAARLEKAKGKLILIIPNGWSAPPDNEGVVTLAHNVSLWTVPKILAAESLPAAEELLLVLVREVMCFEPAATDPAFAGRHWQIGAGSELQHNQFSVWEFAAMIDENLRYPITGSE